MRNILCLFAFLSVFCYEGAPLMIKSLTTQEYLMHKAGFVFNPTILLALATHLGCNGENVALVS